VTQGNRDGYLKLAADWDRLADEIDKVNARTDEDIATLIRSMPKAEAGFLLVWVEDSKRGFVQSFRTRAGRMVVTPLCNQRPLAGGAQETVAPSTLKCF
jgi:hypothetical protein